MPTTWLDLKRPLNPHLDRLLRDLDGLLRSKEIPYLLTGGMARELLLHYGHGCAPGRATTDVDFGVTLASWQDYERLQSALVEAGTFRPDPKQAQRMLHRAVDSTFETKVDLVPFGAIAGPRGELAWPPQGSQVMRVLGYAQALESALHLRLDATQWVPLASGPGLAALKLVAWMDRGEARLGRDAVDFLELLHQYSHVLTDQELYDLHPEAMERHAFQVEPAAAFILGKQVTTQADAPLRAVIREALRPDSTQKMLGYFLRERTLQESSDRLAAATRLLEAFEEGLQETLGRRLVFARNRQGFAGTRDFLMGSQPHLERAGISDEMALAFESDALAPTWDQLIALSGPYGVRAAWLRDGTAPMDF